MQFEVTKSGVHGHKVGDVIEIDGDKVPGWLMNKGAVLSNRTAVTNPAKDPVKEPVAPTEERKALLAEAAKLLDDEKFSDEGVPDVRAINELLESGVEKFTAAERNAIWPDVSEAVKAAREA